MFSENQESKKVKLIRLIKEAKSFIAIVAYNNVDSNAFLEGKENNRIKTLSQLPLNNPVFSDIERTLAYLWVETSGDNPYRDQESIFILTMDKPKSEIEDLIKKNENFHKNIKVCLKLDESLLGWMKDHSSLFSQLNIAVSSMKSERAGCDEQIGCKP